MLRLCTILVALTKLDAWAPSDRYGGLKWATALRGLTSTLSTTGDQPPAQKRVTVLGGTGFVGSRVVQQLVSLGARVTSVSKCGTPPSWCALEPWAKEVSWVSNDLTRGSLEVLSKALGQPDSIVSCVGAVGFDVQGLLLANGVANEAAARAAQAAHVHDFVFVSVASELADCENGWLPHYFSGYFAGKRRAERAFAVAASQGGGRLWVIKPSFIYGGDSFGLFPPRASEAYGELYEEVHSTPFYIALGNVLPGLLKVVYRPPVSVNAVAAACAKAAVFGGFSSDTTVLDGTAAINAAADKKTPTRIANFLAASWKELPRANAAVGALMKGQ